MKKMCEVNTNEVVNETVDNVVETPVEETTNEVTETAEVEVTKEGSVDTPEEERVEAEEYAVNFTLSYSQYLKGQDKTEISDTEAAALIASVVHFYENEAPAKEVRDFFEIPESLNDKIDAKEYNISTEVVSNDVNYQVFLVKYILTFGERIVPTPVAIDDHGDEAIDTEAKEFDDVDVDDQCTCTNCNNTEDTCSDEADTETTE